MLKDEQQGHTTIYIIKIQLAIKKISCENVPNPGHVFKKQCSIYIHVSSENVPNPEHVFKKRCCIHFQKICLLNNFVNKKSNPLLRCFYSLQLTKKTIKKHETKDKSVNNLQNEA